MNGLSRKLLLLSLISSIAFALIGFIIFEAQPTTLFNKSFYGQGKYSFPTPNLIEPTKVEDPAANQDPFSEPTLISDTPTIPVSSGLILIGTLSGQNPKAILAEKTNPKVTHILGLGETLSGEKLVSIGKGFVILLVNEQKVRILAAP